MAIASLIAWLPGLTMMNAASAAEATKPSTTRINKWVDDKGATHYGDNVPTQYSNKNSVINARGMVLQRNDPNNVKAELTPEEIEQARRDRALLASFTTEQEIDLALERHLQMDEITIQGMKQRRVTAVEQLKANQKFADNFKTRKKPVPDDVTKDMKDNQAEIDRIDSQIQQQKDAAEITKKRFDNDRKRFVELKNNAPK